MFIIVFFIFFLSSLYSNESYRIDSNGIHSIKKVPSFFSSNYLIVSDGNYNDGIYRLYDVPKTNEQRILYNGNVNELMHSLTWMHVHGYKDDWKNFGNQLEIAKSRRLSMSCGSITLFALHLCETLSIPARFVLLLTLEEWNTYNNGHSLLEVYHDGKWKLWDIDQRRYFQNKQGDLNAMEFISSVHKNDYEIVKFSESPILAFTDLKLNEYDYTFWYEQAFFSEREYRKFYKRSAQVLLIMQNGTFYFTCDPEHRKRVESYPFSGPFVFLEKNEFMRRFYP